MLLPAQQFPVIIVGKRVIFHWSAVENGETKGGERTADMGADRYGGGRSPNPWH